MDDIYEQRIKNQLKEDSIWSRFFILDSVDSTMDYARSIEDLSHGDVIIAASQTNGHGRVDHSWSSPRGSVYMSLAVKCGGDQQKALIPISALTVFDVVNKYTSVMPEIKWPNDVLLDGKKISGVCMRKVDDIVIVGIGLNVNVAPALENATCINDFIACELDLNLVIGDLLDIFEDYLEDDPDKVISLWKDNVSTIGRRVVVTSNETFEGTVNGLTDEGYLILEQDDGRIIEIMAGDVSEI